MYLIIDEVDGFIEESNRSKYLTFALTDVNKEILEKYRKLWDGIKNSIEINNNQVNMEKSHEN